MPGANPGVYIETSSAAIGDLQCMAHAKSRGGVAYSVNGKLSAAMTYWPQCLFVSSTLNTLRWRRGVAVGCRTRDQEVAGLSLGRALWRKNSE